MSQILTFVLISLVVVPLLAWLQRGSYRESAKPVPSGVGFVMLPSRKQYKLAIGLAAFGVAIGMLIFVLEYPNWQSGAFFWLFFALLSCPYLITLRRRIFATADGLRAVAPLGRDKQISWRDIVSVRFRKWGQTIRLKTASHGTVVIPIYMSGLEDLEKELARHVPSEVRGDAFEKLRAYLAAL